MIFGIFCIKQIKLIQIKFDIQPAVIDFYYFLIVCFLFYGRILNLIFQFNFNIDLFIMLIN